MEKGQGVPLGYRDREIARRLMSGGVEPIFDPETMKLVTKGGWTPAPVVGERDRRKLPEADFNNSPSLMTTEFVKGRDVFHTSTNFSKVLEKFHPFVESGGTLVAGSLGNMDSIVRFIQKKKPKRVVIACVGNIAESKEKDKYAAEDELGAALLAKKLSARKGYVPTDKMNEAIERWEGKFDDPKTIKGMYNAKKLIRDGLGADVEHIIKTYNKREVVPILRQYMLGRIPSFRFVPHRKIGKPFRERLGNLKERIIRRVVG
jgi:phosphosulfolactate phosphohydrolase-like enzyme